MNTCVLRDHRPFCWGYAEYGAVGVPPLWASPEYNHIATPTEVEKAPDLVAIFGHDSGFCGITAARRLWCWGDLPGLSERGLPQEVPILGVREVALGNGLFCALVGDGTVMCLGDGAVAGEPSALASKPFRSAQLEGVRAVFSFGGAVCGTSWGAPRCLGNSPHSPTIEPGSLALAPPADVVSVGAGHEHACALLRSGKIRCWGDEREGRLGREPVKSGLPLRWNELDLDGFEALAVGSHHTCALRADGTIWCWGRNISGQLGNGAETDSDQPSRVKLAAARELVAGGNHNCAVLRDDSIWCWGDNQSGQLGLGANEPGRALAPTQPKLPD